MTDFYRPDRRVPLARRILTRERIVILACALASLALSAMSNAGWLR